MTYMVISEDGVLFTKGDPVDIEVVTREVGPEGWNYVHLDDRLGMMAWVNDLSHARYRRNVAGSVMLAMLGAGQMPYAGAVVLTAYDRDCESGLPRDLDVDQVVLLQRIAQDTMLCLAGGNPEGAPDGHPERVRDYAAAVEAATVPVMTVNAVGGPVDMASVVTPRCPRCDRESRLVISVIQAICTTDDCRVFTWNPSETREQFEASAKEIDLDPPAGEQGGR